MIVRLMGMTLLLVVASIAAAEGYDFKGVFIDQPSTPAEILSKLGVKCGEGMPGYQICNGRVSIAGHPGDMNLVIGPSTKVQRIYIAFASSDFISVENALITKFGQPKIEILHLQNGFGSTFDGNQETWGAAPEPTVILSQYAGSISRSSVVFRSEDDRVMLEKQFKGNPNDI